MSRKYKESTDTIFGSLIASSQAILSLTIESHVTILIASRDFTLVLQWDQHFNNLPDRALSKESLQYANSIHMSLSQFIKPDHISQIVNTILRRDRRKFYIDWKH